MVSNWHYKRTKLAKATSLRLQDGLFSRIAYIGSRRIGKTAFLINDLSPQLVNDKCIPIYISLWKNETAPQMEFIGKLMATRDALKKRGSLMALLQSEITKVSFGNSLIGKVDVDVALKNTPVTTNEIQLIGDLLIEVLTLAKNKRVVLLIDEMQHLLTDKAFKALHYALRTIFDELGDRIGVLFTGSSRTGVTAMFENEDLPFYHSAQPREFPLIDDGIVEFFIDKLKNTYSISCDLNTLSEFWLSVNKSPYWLVILMRYVVEEQISVELGVEHINLSITETKSFKTLMARLTLIEKLVLVRIDSAESLYSVNAITFYKLHGENPTRSKIQTAVTKLVTKKVLTTLPNNKHIIEIEGLVASVKRELDEK